MLKANIVDFVASDAHSPDNYNYAKKSFELLKSIIDDDKFSNITEYNQQKVLNNELIEVDLEDMRELKKDSKFLSFVKKVLRK